MTTLILATLILATSTAGGCRSDTDQPTTTNHEPNGPDEVHISSLLGVDEVTIVARMGVEEVTAAQIERAIYRRAMARALPVTAVVPEDFPDSTEFFRTIAVEILQDRLTLRDGQRLALLPSEVELINAWREHQELGSLYLEDLDEVELRLNDWAGIGLEDIYHLLRIEIVRSAWLDRVVERVTEEQLWDEYYWRNDTLTILVIEIPNLPSVEELNELVEIPPSTSWFENFYQEHPGRFVLPPSVDIRIVRIRVAEDGPEAEVEAARDRVEALYNEVINDGDLVSMSITQSEDPAADNGGVRFQVTRRQIRSALDLPTGELSQIEQDRYGFFFYRVEERRSRGRRPLDNALRREIASYHLSRALPLPGPRALADRLLASLYADDRTRVDQLVAAENVISREISQIRREDDGMIPGVGQSQEFLEQLFTLSELQPTIPEPVHIDGSLFVVRLLQRSTPTRAEFAADRELFAETHFHLLRETAFDAYWGQFTEQTPVLMDELVRSSSE